MSYQRAYGTVDKMMDKFPWFHRCVKAATFTEIGESYDVKEFLENGLQLSLPLRPETRKELHFDLGTAALSENYNSIRPNAWRGAWSLIRIFMERNGFIHTQYSGYESIAVMPIDKAMAVMEKLQQRYPWFKDSLLAASVTEVGERHDALSYIKGSHGIIVPVPAHSLEREEPDFFGSEIGDMKSATAELSKRNGLEPPKDLNRALEKAPVKWPGLSFPEIDDCFALSSYFVAPQEEHLYPVVTVSSHASRTCTCSS